MKIKNIGIPSLMMIFLTLALTLFAALSLSIASTDKKYSQKNAEHKKAYYEATNKSEMMLKEIDDILMEAYETSHSADEYFNLATTAIEDDEKKYELANLQSSIPIVSWQLPIDDRSSLAVEIELTLPSDNPRGEFYRILKWQSCSN